MATVAQPPLQRRRNNTVSHPREAQEKIALIRGHENHEKTTLTHRSHDSREKAATTRHEKKSLTFRSHEKEKPTPNSDRSNERRVPLHHSAILPEQMTNKRHSIHIMGRTMSEHLSSCVLPANAHHDISESFNKQLKETKKHKDLDTLLNYAKAYELKGDYEKAFELFGAAAEAGSESAEVVLGRFYSAGLGVKKSRTTAAKFFKSAADTGNSAGLYYYGEALMKGKGVHKDKHAGGAYIAMSAKLNYPPAMFRLGHLYEKGEGGMEKNKEEADKWYRKSAENGYSLALSKISRNRQHARVD